MIKASSWNQSSLGELMSQTVTLPQVLEMRPVRLALQLPEDAAQLFLQSFVGHPSKHLTVDGLTPRSAGTKSDHDSKLKITRS